MPGGGRTVKAERVSAEVLAEPGEDLFPPVHGGVRPVVRAIDGEEGVAGVLVGVERVGLAVLLQRLLGARDVVGRGASVLDAEEPKQGTLEILREVDRGDVQGAIDYLRTLPYVSGKVGVIGYCSGGRQAYLAACTLRGIDAAIDCYGGGVVAKPEELTARQPVAPIDFTKDLQCPLLGLFGVEDTRPSPDDVAHIEEALKKHGKTYAVHTYENAGHAFFAVNRPNYRPHAAVDGWEKVFAWFGKYLG